MRTLESCKKGWNAVFDCNGAQNTVWHSARLGSGKHSIITNKVVIAQVLLALPVQQFRIPRCQLFLRFSYVK